MAKRVTSSSPEKAQRPKRPAAERAVSTAQNAARREIAAYWLGIGVTQQRAADECGADLRTVQRWCAEPEFREQVAAHRRQAFDEIAPQMFANVRLALDVERRVMNGELARDDDSAVEARDLLTRFRAASVVRYRERDPGELGASAARGYIGDGNIIDA